MAGTCNPCIGMAETAYSLYSLANLTYRPVRDLVLDRQTNKINEQMNEWINNEWMNEWIVVGSAWGIPLCSLAYTHKYMNVRTHTCAHIHTCAYSLTYTEI